MNDSNVEISTSCAAVVLGGYINGFSIIRELYECGVKNIVLVDYGRSLSCRSNKISCHLAVKKNKDSLLIALRKLGESYKKMVLFPTDDMQLEFLNGIYDEIDEFCFVPFNRTNLLQCLDKSHQYATCKKLGIPYPRTVLIQKELDWVQIDGLTTPLLIKPAMRDDLSTSVFRNAYVSNRECLKRKKEWLLLYVKNGVKLLVSECIPGDDTNIYAYTAYRSKEGVILNEWIGKKLTQYPDQFGVFASATNSAPKIIRDYGRNLIENMNIYGIVEPEFKFDYRDGKYKLMEINLRSMMWNRLGNRSGVHLQHSQWLDAVGEPVPSQTQELEQSIHFVYMKHELLNLIYRRGYWKYFKKNVFGGDVRSFAVYDPADIKPFLFDCLYFPRTLLGTWLRHFGKR